MVGTAVVNRVGVEELVAVGEAVVGTAVVVLLGVVDGVRVDVAGGVSVSLVGEVVIDGVTVGGNGTGVSGTAVTVSRSWAPSFSEAAAMVGSKGANSKS